MAKHIIFTYWKYAWRYKWRLIALITTVVTAILIFRFAPSIIIAGVIDRLSKGQYTGDVWASFGMDIMLFVIVSVVGGIILWRLAVILLWTLEIKVVRDIYQHIFSHLMKLDANFHANRFGGSLVSQTNKFAGSYVRVVDTTVFEVSGLVFSFIFTAIILWPRAPIIVIMLGIFSILFILISIKITKRVRELNAVEAAKTNRQTGFLADMVTNVMAVKSYSANIYESKRFALATNEVASASTDLMKASAKRDIFYSTSTLTVAIGAFILSILSVVFWKADVATVYLILQYTGIITQELWQFSRSTLRNYNKAIGDAEEMTQILALEPSVKDNRHAKSLDLHGGEITFNKVLFNHDGADHPIFENFTLTIGAGQKVGLVGHSGSGKTTFTRLLLRFSDIEQGSITIDGQNISEVTQNDLRNAIAYVPQEPLLFHRSLRENIAYGNPDATEEQILEAAKKAHVLEFIEQLPDRFDTLVGERGVKLSGGQRQRIAIARAILKDAPILVLDEATSALDSESEKLIQDALAKLMKNRTSIVIAHRLSTIAKLDRVIVLDKGNIVEDGSHETLLEKKGTYAKLWSHQSGGFIEE